MAIGIDVVDSERLSIVCGCFLLKKIWFSAIYYRSSDFLHFQFMDFLHRPTLVFVIIRGSSSSDIPTSCQYNTSSIGDN